MGTTLVVAGRGGDVVVTTMEHLIAEWGYLAIVIGTFFEGETVVAVGAALAHRGWLDVRRVALASFVGSVAGDQLWYWVGRRLGPRALASRPGWAERARRVERRIGRFGDAFVVGLRFLYGLRTISPVVLGASGYPPLRFAILDGIGAAAWAVAISAAGWALGSGLTAILGRAARLEELAALGAVLALAGAIVVRLVRRPRPGSRASRARDVDQGDRARSAPRDRAPSRGG